MVKNVTENNIVLIFFLSVAGNSDYFMLQFFINKSKYWYLSSCTLFRTNLMGIWIINLFIRNL